MLKFFFHTFLLVPTFLNAQVGIINRSLTDSSLNIVYADVDDTVELIGYKNKANLNFSTTNGIMRDLGQYRYRLYSLKEGECTITFKEKEKIIAQKTFKAELIPGPIGRFSSKYDSIVRNAYYITLNSLIKDPVFRIEPPHFYKYPLKIISYRITLDGGTFNGTVITEFVVTGAELTKDQIQKIKNYGSNTFMTIEDIRVIDSYGKWRKLTPLIFYIN